MIFSITYSHLRIKDSSKFVEGAILVLATSYPVNGSLKHAVIYVYIGPGLVEHSQHEGRQPSQRIRQCFLDDQQKKGIIDRNHPWSV